MCKLAFFMTTKNSEKSLRFALRWKNREYLFFSELHRNVSAGQSSLAKNVSAIRFEVRRFVTTICSRHHFRAYFSKTSKLRQMVSELVLKCLNGLVLMQGV